MAIKVTKQVVCDLGEKHTGPIKSWRLTTERESKTFDLCPSCSRPLTRLWERGGEARRVPGRMRVLTMSEIESLKHSEPPHSTE